MTAVTFRPANQPTLTSPGLGASEVEETGLSGTGVEEPEFSLAVIVDWLAELHITHSTNIAMARYTLNA
jgi:hypothetical protein